ncbi:MAG: peptidoglycan DD-metalloendopeptidase family protein [Deltaproteobacteria bacterium]|nr:peptidoglycan DD-metalloendopeptidase family protein [Deltaproteobacteria bacterium]
MPLPGTLPTAPFSQGIESLRGRTDPAAMRAAVREMESLFAYEMVKAMRSASGTSAAGSGGFGGDVYGSLFDMELARVLSSRNGLGLQEILMKRLGQSEYSQKNKENQKDTENVDSAAEGIEPSAAAPATVVPSAVVPSTATPAAIAAPEVPAPHTHDPLEEGGPAVTISGEGALPIREGGRVSSAFGYRRDPFTGADKFHHGIDIAAAEGTEVYPAKGGEVTFSGYRKGYGNIVEVDHGDGIVTKYAHNRANRVATGDRVGADTVIAEVGSTGRSTGPHLHFEVQYGGRKVPPQAIFAEIAKGRG